ncbi:MAG: hypothetical protein JOZ41_14705 [Chloroflexi bacterium]|nr:hypothetical protein [Chloroflexota bacterium]
MDAGENVETFDDDGALTAAFLLQRGYCCGLGCKNCPYEPRHAGPGAQPPFTAVPGPE